MIRCPAYGADAFKIEAARGECKATCGRTARARRLGSAVWRGARDAHARRRRGERTHARRSSVARAPSRLPRAAAGPGRRAARQRGRGRGRRIVPRVERHARWRSDEAAQQGAGTPARRSPIRNHVASVVGPSCVGKAPRHARRSIARPRRCERETRTRRPTASALPSPSETRGGDRRRRAAHRSQAVPSAARARRQDEPRMGGEGGVAGNGGGNGGDGGDGDDAAAARRRHPPARGAAAQPARR